MRDVDLALSEISNIRAHLVASTCFQGIAPGFNLLVGALVFILAAAQSLQPQAQQQDSLHYVALWAGVIGAISVVAAVQAVSRARRLHGGMAFPMLCAVLQKILPFAAAGIVITWVIFTFAPASAWLLPGLWQILIGLLGFSVVSSMPRGIVLAAAWYFLCGAVVMGLAGRSGTLSPWMMGIPFGIGQTVVALILSRASGDSRACE